MSNIYLCDIDGTISDFRHHRGPFDEHKVLGDIPLPTIELIKALEKSGARIIFFSGRSKACHSDSVLWIEKHLGSTPELYMREVGDYRSDDIVKEEMYNKYVKDKHTVLGVFDDRLKVCRMWYKLGIFVFNCNQGLIEF